MNREELEELLSRSLDEKLPPAEAHLLARALEEQAELRQLRDDLLRIKALAPRLPVPQAPELDFAMMARVRKTYGPTRKRLVWTGALTAMAAACLLFFNSDRFHRPVEPEQVELAQASGSERVQLSFYRGIAPLEEMALRRLVGMQDNQANRYARHLNRLNRTISYCEQVMEQYPGNDGNREALSDAYVAKADLLQKIIET